MPLADEHRPLRWLELIERGLPECWGITRSWADDPLSARDTHLWAAFVGSSMRATPNACATRWRAVCRSPAAEPVIGGKATAALQQVASNSRSLKKDRITCDCRTKARYSAACPIA